MNQTITFTPEERKTLRAAMANYRDHCRVRASQYNDSARMASSEDGAKVLDELSKTYNRMADDTLHLLCRIEE